MCRSAEFHGLPSNRSRERLKIRSFVVGFSSLDAGKPLPHTLTLVYLPRINDNALEVSGSKVRPDCPAFVSLHRGVGGGEVWFGSRERVVVSEGVRFELYLREEKVLKGNFWRDDGDEWRLDCGCVMESEIDGVAAETVAEVSVAAEGGVAAMRERVAMTRRRRRRWGGRRGLEEIPEERELESDDRDDRTVVGDCDCDCEGRRWDGGDLCDDGMDGGDEEGIELDEEGVGWAVDVGIWVVCLGVGFLVSKASSKSLRRKRIL